MTHNQRKKSAGVLDQLEAGQEGVAGGGTTYTRQHTMTEKSIRLDSKENYFEKYLVL
jgi:hypothetical protein